MLRFVEFGKHCFHMSLLETSTDPSQEGSSGRELRSGRGPVRSSEELRGSSHSDLERERLRSLQGAPSMNGQKL